MWGVNQWFVFVGLAQTNEDFSWFTFTSAPPGGSWQVGSHGLFAGTLGVVSRMAAVRSRGLVGL